MSLTNAQVAQLLKPINPARVAILDGLSHLEAYDVRAHLIRCFGFGGWSGDVLSMELLYEEPATLRNGKPGFKVAYRCLYRLTITDLCSYTEAAVGESMMPDFKRGDCHDMAAKTAESQALKRCAVNLGDQFGLSLYRKGSTAPLVLRTLVDEVSPGHPGAPVDEGTPDIVPEHPTAPEAPDASGVAAAPPPAEPSGAPFPSDEELGAVQRAHVEALRDKVILALGNKHPKDGLAVLTRCNLDASRHKLMQEMTVTPKGEPCTVAVLIDEAIKHLSREPVAP